MCSLCPYIVHNCPGASSAPLVNVWAGSTDPLSVRLSGPGLAMQMFVSTDSASEVESEEELKEPGSSIDQQIHLTPIAQSLKASPMDVKQPGCHQH